MYVACVTFECVLPLKGARGVGGFKNFVLHFDARFAAHGRLLPKIVQAIIPQSIPKVPGSIVAAIGRPIERFVRKGIVVKAQSGTVGAATGIANLHLGLYKGRRKPRDGQVLDRFAQIVASKRVPLAPIAQQTRLDEGNARVAIVSASKFGDKGGHGIEQQFVVVIGRHFINAPFHKVFERNVAGEQPVGNFQWSSQIVNVKAQYRVARASLGRLENALDIGPIARIWHATHGSTGIVEQDRLPTNVIKFQTVRHTRFIVVFHGSPKVGTGH
jgi:hypothetical protein